VTERLVPTMRLRFDRRVTMEPHQGVFAAMRSERFVLQQCYIDTQSRDVWRDVQVVDSRAQPDGATVR
jgi:hypothetical protein